MSDSFLQVVGEDEPNESEIYISAPRGALPGVTAEAISTSGAEENSVIHADEDASIGETVDNELFYKMSEDSLDLMSGQDSPIGGKQSILGYPDTDSCLSVSPSPDPDSKKKTFDFSMIDPTAGGSNLSAAIQTEQEFLDFMFSLPQIQKEATAKEQLTKAVPALSPPKEVVIERPKADKKSPTRGGQNMGNTSRVGLDHLDNLCRMMEQLGELKEQNTRLQRRVQYLEELKALQEMHRDMQDSIAARKTALSLGSVSLSDSDLRLEDLNKSCAYLLDSEESLDQSVSVAKSKGKRRRRENIRARSHSMGIEGNCNLLLPSPTSGKNNKVSRWSRVREALKWERATVLPEAPLFIKAKEIHHSSSFCPSKTSAAAQNLYMSGVEGAPYPIVNPPSLSSLESSNPSQALTEEDILNLYRMALPAHENQMLELPNSSMHLQRHSSSEDDRRPKDDPQRTSDKEKKGHKSAWGKVKHMISYNSKRDNMRKKSASVAGASRKVNPMLTKSLSVASAKACGQDITSTVVGAEGIGISDPEEYDLEYESMDPDGTSWDWEGDGEGGIWMGPKNSNETTEGIGPCLLSVGDNFLVVPKNKPQLTITVPSSENLQHVSVDHSRLSSDFKGSAGSCPSKGDVKSGVEFPATPPSPRRSSNWTKVKQAFLTGPATNQQAPDHEMANSQNRHRQIQPNNQHHYQQYRHNHQQGQHSVARSSHPPSPSKRKKQLKSNFSFDVGSIQGPDESDSPSGVSPEISPDDFILQSHRRPSKGHPRTGPGARHGSLPSSVVHKNLIDLQRTLTGEFNKKLQEWDRFRSHQGVYGGGVEGTRSGEVPKGGQQHTGENLPQEFRKKLHEWEKMKGRDKEKHSRSSETRVQSHTPHSHLLQLHHHPHQMFSQDDLKTKIHGEDDLPPDFKKKLTEWEIRKALVGKGQQNVEQLQKNLGEEFNKKLVEWERMKALGQGKISAQGISSLAGPSYSASDGTQLQHGERSSALRSLHIAERSTEDGSAITLREQVPIGARIYQLAAATGGFVPQSQLDRKGSAHKVKKSKSGKIEKAPMAKPEGQKNRDKELLWLEKELHKIEREKQRLEREKVKFLEREARLEKMRHAMRQGPAEKKEIYIKTSTGEFRFEGISQTFTKKLYEWEERRGIRPESSTFVLLDPNYRAPVKEEQNSNIHQSPETKRITRSRSESSLVEMGQTGGISALISHQSSISLNEMEKEEATTMQAENKSASEPTLCADEIPDTSKCAMLVQMEELVEVGADTGQAEVAESKVDEMQMKSEGGRSRKTSSVYPDTYDPSEITRMIGSSGSDENLTRQEEVDEELAVVATNGIVLTTPTTFETQSGNLVRSDSQRSEESYRSLLHENMTLLGKLKEQETLCRALETQMGDIDCKMDNVADQHLKTLEKLHRHVTIMKKSESSSRMSDSNMEGDSSDEGDVAESNQRLIEQLKARIVELEMKGDKLMEEKEDLECAFKLHKDHETQIAESLLIRIRELQDAGAEVNIQTVQCQTEDSFVPGESRENSNDPKLVKGNQELMPAATTSSSSSATTAVTTTTTATATTTTTTKKKRRKRRDEYNKNNEDDAYEEDKEESDDGSDERRAEKDGKEQQKRKRKIPPKKVQKLHNLTADLLFQAKRLEGALVAKHHLPYESHERSGGIPSRLPRKRSLRGRGSLRLSRDEGKAGVQRKITKGPGTARTWSSIEAIVSPEDGKPGDSTIWETRAAALASESQDLLAMNAELSRMARELRKEMMSVWNFRESTSPESNSSDTREETIKAKIALTDLNICEVQAEENDMADKAKEKDDWLAEEAREVFDGIATLQPLDSEHSQNLVSVETEMSDSDERCKDSSLATVSQRVYVEVLEDNTSDDAGEPMVESEEHFLSWWDVPFPKKSKSLSKCRKETLKESAAAEDAYVEGSETPDFTDFETLIPGSSGTRLGDLLKPKEEPVDNEFSEENETVNSFRLSPYYNITFPRASRASSTTSEDDKKDRKHSFIQDNGGGSASGTLKTNASSTFKSDILSSSFEYEDKGKIDSRPSDVQNLSHVNKDNWLETSPLNYPPAMKSEFTPTQLDKVGKMIEEAVLIMEEDKKRETFKKHVNADTDEKEIPNIESNLEQTKFETEVTAGSKISGEDGGLRTRRVSDTQVEYEANLQKDTNFQQCIENDEIFHVERNPKMVIRIPSIRRNQSESDVSWLQSPKNYPPKVNKETPSDVFVTTHRTIFTISGERNSVPTKVTPTFLQDNDTVGQSTESIDTIDQDLSDSTLKEELSLSSVNNSGYHHHLERKNSSTPFASEDKTESFITDKYNKDTNTTNCDRTQADPSNLNQYSSSFSSSPISPAFLDALSSSFHPNNPPLESKKKVLEAANESSPTVKNMIDLYNKRITEKQELLINPFKPGDPFTEKKNSQPPTDNFKNLVSQAKDKKSGHVVNSKDCLKGKVLKSRSASVLKIFPPLDTENIQRSFSKSSGVIRRKEIFEPQSAPVEAILSPLTLMEHPNISFSHSGTDISSDFDASTEDSTDTLSESRVSSPQPSSEKGPAGKLRAIKIKKAKEEFLSRGAAPLQTGKRLSGEFDYHSEAISAGDHIQNRREKSVPSSHPPLPSSVDIRGASEAPTKPPRVMEARQLPTSHKESSRRQSESCLPEGVSLRSNVVKSASSGLIELRKKHAEGRPPSNKENRKSCLDPSDNKRSSKGIFKLFKRSRGKDRKDLGTVQTLCRQSLSVDISSPNKATASGNDGQQPSTSSSPPLVVPHPVPEDGSRTSRTLPRETQSETSASSSRSCPSSPVTLRKSKTAQWLAKGKSIFKSRSPSPNKRPR